VTKSSLKVSRLSNLINAQDNDICSRLQQIIQLTTPPNPWKKRQRWTVFVMHCADRTIWSSVLILVIMAFGIFGNVCSIIVVSHRSMRAPVIVLIIGLAISNIFLLIVVNLVARVPALTGSASACFETYHTLYTFGNKSYHSNPFQWNPVVVKWGPAFSKVMFNNI